VASEGAEGTIKVAASEYKFDPSTLTVAAGSVTFEVTNSGNEEHEFEVFKGETVIDEIEGLVPGLTRTLSVTLEAGDYTYVCKLAGHDALGMKGTLAVAAG
jgi:iron uptake system component EfeO